MADGKDGYDYKALEADISRLKDAYPFLDIVAAGKSVLGRNIYCIKLGYGPSEVFYNGAHHSNEWITSMLLMQFARNFMRAYSEGLRMRGYDTVNIFEKCSIFVMPMVNPDGVDFVINGPDSGISGFNLPVDISGDRNQWKANIRGVDLNLNYPAGWDRAKAYEKLFKAVGPSPSRHAGPNPLSEPESRAVAEFTGSHDFKIVIAYHTQGKEIYWRYQDFDPPRSRAIANLFSSASTYGLSETIPEDSFAGFKDWFIMRFNRPGFTIEAGYGKNPLPVSQLPDIYDDNEEIMLMTPLLGLY